VVIGAGKAAAAMAQAVEQHWNTAISGLVVTRYGHAVPCRHIQVVEAAHPVPDHAGLRSARRILDLVRGLSNDDLVLCLLSGGGSALLTLPAPGIELQDKQQVTRELLLAGATISEINCVRKHLSAIKGGRLGTACWPAKVCALIISDVPGDDPAVVASGPTVADPTTYRDALNVLQRFEINLPRSISEHLSHATEETPKPGDPKLQHVRNVVVARARDALSAAARHARRNGVEPTVLGDDLEGEACVVARQHAAHALDMATTRTPPWVLLSGGETTVTVRGRGRGGRNLEYALCLALALDGAPNIYALACDTDGIDGVTEAAGAIVEPDTLDHAARSGTDPQQCLNNNDAYSMFVATDSVVATGPTRTNVNDFRAILNTG